MLLEEVLSLVCEGLGLLDALPQGFLRFLYLFDLFVWCLAHCRTSAAKQTLEADVPLNVGETTKILRCVLKVAL